MNKKLLLVVAIIGIGLYALPATMSLFAGQHSFVNIDATGNQIDCTKCHGDVKSELQSSGNSATTGSPAPHAAFKCEYCHRIVQGSASGDNAYATIPYLQPDGTAVRVYFVPVSDMEAGNVPATIAGSDVMISSVNGLPCTGTANVCDTLAGTKLQFVPGHNGGAMISAPTLDVVLTAAPKSNWKINPTYNVKTGLPYDTQASTMSSGLDLSKMVVIVTSSAGSPRATITVTNWLGVGSKAVNPGSAYHAASLVSCMECHGGSEPVGHYSRVVDGTQNGGKADCSNCHYGNGNVVSGNAGSMMTTLWAGGFGLTSMPNDTGAKEAHMEFTTTDDKTTVYQQGASNGACTGCHSHVAVQINYTKPTTYIFNANTQTDPMTVGGFVVGGQTSTLNVGK